MALLALVTLPACAPRAADPTLQPPGAPRTIIGETVIRDLSSYDFATGYPKRFLEQRVAFNAACESSSRSSDEDAAADAALLFKLSSESGSPEQFAASLQGKFELVQYTVAPSEDPAVLPADAGMMTGYATPEIAVRTKPDERFRFPLFGDLRKTNPELATLTRRELMQSEEARAAAIAWIDDPLAWAIVETNGSAACVVNESKGKEGMYDRRFAITRVGTNDRPWTSVGRWLAYRGLLDGATYTFLDVAKAATDNPAKIEEAALDNERVVFFGFAKETAFPPVYGLPKGRLMSGYSCAADQSIYPPGSVLVVFERGAEAKSQRTPRILFVQDAGGAIVGPGRVDAYFGAGTEALVKAGQLRAPISVYRLRAR